jgi:hypothetical protein
MNLYTEEQMRDAIKMARNGVRSEDNIIGSLNFIKPTIELPSDEEIWRWWQTQKFQKEQGEQEYTMLYEIDLPKILKSFTEHLIQGGNK